jgi:hypothetical protein
MNTEQIMPRLAHGSGPRVDGSKTRMWNTRKGAERGAKAIGWPTSAVSKIHTRFMRGYALNNGILPGYLTPEQFGELYRARNPNGDGSEL